MLRIDTGDRNNNFIGSVQEFNHRYHYTDYPIFNSLKIKRRNLMYSRKIMNIIKIMLYLMYLVIEN